MHVEPRRVMVWFGRPIEPQPVAAFVRAPVVKDPPLDVDELEGTLSAWQLRDGVWHGFVEYRFPTHGIGMQNYMGWFPASRLRLGGNDDTPLLEGGVAA